jgi:hypothetical protein
VVVGVDRIFFRWYKMGFLKGAVLAILEFVFSIVTRKGEASEAQDDGTAPSVSRGVRARIRDIRERNGLRGD